MCSEPSANDIFICSVKIKVLAIQLIQVCCDFASCFTSYLQAFAHGIPMKCKIQSVFLKYHPILQILLGFVKLSTVITESRYQNFLGFD